MSLHGNTYAVDAALVGRRVELVFDPFDLTDIAVRYQGRDVGAAVPHRIGRHVHPAARPEIPDPDEPKPVTGIDYLKLVHDRHTAALARRVNYAHLTDQTRHSEEVLEAELASFAGLATDGPTAAVLADLAAIDDADPDQLDMLTLIDEQDDSR